MNSQIQLLFCDSGQSLVISVLVANEKLILISYKIFKYQNSSNWRNVNLIQLTFVWRLLLFTIVRKYRANTSSKQYRLIYTSAACFKVMVSICVRLATSHSLYFNVGHFYCLHFHSNWTNKTIGWIDCLHRAQKTHHQHDRPSQLFYKNFRTILVYRMGKRARDWSNIHMLLLWFSINLKKKIHNSTGKQSNSNHNNKMHSLFNTHASFTYENKWIFPSKHTFGIPQIE